MAGFFQRDLDADYFVDDDSDVERGSSSDDELDFTIHCANQKRVRVRHSSVSSKGSSAESDFEKEMNEELDRRVTALEEARKSGQTISGSKNGETSKPGTSSERSKQDNGFNDDIYFDSDEEDMIKGGDKKKREKLEKMTNDDLLYDPDQDDDDQRWVDNHRRSLMARDRKAPRKLPTSDAVLDCPACMTTLCLDCQKHEKYHNQYRAMFVMNCHVDFSELLKQPPQKSKKRKRQQGSQGSQQQEVESSTEEEEKLHPVRCTECNTVVGVFDTDEVYHFFNVLAGH
ncbi:E2F-associated phosphoprotein-like [Saccostrea cucullata]|uniref:E2F-associated phosphoprotein-like n=1 Tax=Saccostrea cuccullata TaxID=36930 RepID=UPI002ECFDBC0